MPSDRIRKKTKPNLRPPAPPPRSAPRSASRRWAVNWLIAPLCFLLCATVYSNAPTFYTAVYDSMWSIPTSLEWLRYGDTQLDRYPGRLQAAEFHATDRVNGHYYNWYPAAVPILASPVVWLLVEYSRLGTPPTLPNLEQTVPLRIPIVAEQHAAALLTALAATLFFLTARRRLNGDVARALLLTALFAFGSSAYSTASRALWQHTLSLPLLTAALWAYTRSHDRQQQARWLYLVALCAGLAYAVRSTNILSVLLFAGLTAFRHRRQLPGFLLIAIGVQIPFWLLNQSVYGHIYSPYMQWQAASSHLLSRHLPESLAGTLVSPNRGLVTFTPILTFLAVPVSRWLRRFPAAPDWEELGFFAVIAGQWIGIAQAYPWWGGYCYGPRLMTDILPYAFLLLVPAVERLSWRPVTFRAASYAGAFALCAFLSLWIHYVGTHSQATLEWNWTPQSIDQHPERIWSWNDLQVFRR